MKFDTRLSDGLFYLRLKGFFFVCVVPLPLGILVINHTMLIKNPFCYICRSRVKRQRLAKVNVIRIGVAKRRRQADDYRHYVAKQQRQLNLRF